MLKRLLLVALVLMGFAAPAAAQICASIPFTFVAGTVINPSQVNANFTGLLGCVNANGAHNGANSDITSLSALTTLTTGFILNTGDYSSSGTGELGLPAGTTGQRTGSPVAGQIRFNTTTGQFEGYGGAAWGSFSAPAPPTGRLTLASGVPVMASTVSAATSVLYTPYIGNQVPIWNGSGFAETAFAETAQLLSDTTLSPAAAVQAACYDYFAWSNAGTIVVTRGPAWTNCTTRGYTIPLVQGVRVNFTSISNGPAAGFGTFVGSVATDAGAVTVSWLLNGSGSGGVAGLLDVWNMYNRVQVTATDNDTGVGYSYTSATVRQARASAGNQITFISGLAEDGLGVYYNNGLQTNGVETLYTGIGLDTTTAFSCQFGIFDTRNLLQDAPFVKCGFPPQLGKHVAAALEENEAAGGSPSFDFFSLNQLGVELRM